MSTPEGTAAQPTLDEITAQAWALLERRRFDHARRLVSEALRRDPDDVGVLHVAATLDWMEDRNDDALVATRRVLELAPEHYGARHLLGRLLRETKSYADSERVWIELLREYPEDADAYAEYAGLMLDTLHVDKARALAAEGLRHEPEHAGCLFVTALVDVIRSPGAPSDSLQSLLREHPENARAGIALVVSLSQQRRNREAHRVARELLAADPANDSLVELVRELRATTHWSMLPLYPMQRWGWGGAAAVWLGAVLLLPVASRALPPGVGGTLFIVWICYAIYSWVWPSVIRKLI